MLLHVLPGGIKRIRHYGVRANGCKKTQLAPGPGGVATARPQRAGAGIGRRLHDPRGPHRAPQLPAAGSEGRVLAQARAPP
ncbi:hypothetical protein [Roseateles oligotrophus]|uniref:hypothetical protein n=1 Tax=Roseateles oligotrophus TaxID=1769250 RepID=UPI0039648B81